MELNKKLTVKVIDKALAKINYFKAKPGLDYRNFGLCWILGTLFPHQVKANVNEEDVDDMVDYLCELDGIPPADKDEYVPEWGDIQDVTTLKWYEKRVDVLLKARSLLTNQFSEDYV